jgi:tetratricopeptide (TPR) repeat protein
VARHPADWVVSLAPALGLLQRTPPRTAEALAWAGRAQLLAPHSWRAHAVTAAVLARGGRRSQARVEAKLGLSELGGTTYAEPLQVAASVANTVEEALEATPDDAHVRADLVRLLLDQRRAPLAVGLAEAELQRLGPDPAPADRAAWGELKARRAFVLLDQQRFAEAAAEAAGLPRTECLGPAIAARAARGLGKPEQEVERLLLSGLADCPGGSDLAQALVRGRLSRGDGPGALALLDLPAVGGPQVGWPADAHLWRAEALELLGRQREALRERWLAAVMAPGRAELGLAYAERLRSAGDLDGALAALRRLAMTAPEEARKVLLDRAADLDRQRLMQALPGYPSLAPRPPPSPPTPAAP